MSCKKTMIPYYDDINEFIGSVPMEQRTKDPFFYCLRLEENEGSSYKPSFRRGFYYVALLSRAERTKITFDNTSAGELNTVLIFQSPGLVYSFQRDSSTHGYIIYFKKQCIDFFKPSIEIEFPFFNLQHTNLFQLTEQKFRELSPFFEEVFSAYDVSMDPHHKVAALKLIAMLYQLKELVDLTQWPERFATLQQVLFSKFIRLVDNFYIEKRTVEEYADLLAVSPNHLSQSIKLVTGKNALSHINERIVTEAMSLIRYTHMDIAEIAYSLNFSDPANFGKFFRRLTGTTPLEFRKKKSPGN
jgi:AraC family transcriptional regulator, transcriptional activator of pobA